MYTHDKSPIVCNQKLGEVTVLFFRYKITLKLAKSRATISDCVSICSST